MLSKSARPLRSCALLLILLLCFSLPAWAAPWQDGLYQDIGKGYSGDLVVTVSIRNGAITDIQAQGKNGNVDDFLKTATDTLVPAILQNNGLEGVDSVSGATASSQGVFQAMEGVLAQASAQAPAPGGGPSAPPPTASAVPLSTLDAEVFTGLGSTANFRVGPGKDEAGVPVYSFNVVMAGCLFDKEGRILSARVDVYEVATPNYDGKSMPHFSGWPARQGYNITDPDTGKVTGVSINTEQSAGDEVAAWRTKRERGDQYGMNPTNEWHRQMDAYERWMVGKTPAELRGWFARYTSPRNGRPIKSGSEDAEDQKMLAAISDEEKAGLADVVSMATMSLSDAHGQILEAVEKAYENRVPAEGLGVR